MRTHVEQRLKALDFLVVVDFFLSETAELADVVLPAAQWAEEDGTMTNLEGRVILRRRAFDPPAGVRTDLEVLCALAARFGKRPLVSVRQQPARCSTSCGAPARGGPADYSGITYERIEAEDGVFWPCPAADHPGTPRLFADRFPTPSGRARFHAVAPRAAGRRARRRVPAVPHHRPGAARTTSRGRRRGASPELEALMPEPFAEMHPVTARLAGVANGERVSSRRAAATATFTLKVTPTIREDTVFVPFHWGGEQSANRLTNAALDPISRMPEFKVCAVRVAAAAATDPT